MDSVVDALIGRGLDPTVRLADANHLGDLPALKHDQWQHKNGRGEHDVRLVVADAEALELALLVALVDGPQGVFIGHGPVGAMEVPHVN